MHKLTKSNLTFILASIARQRENSNQVSFLLAFADRAELLREDDLLSQIVGSLMGMSLSSAQREATNFFHAFWMARKGGDLHDKGIAEYEHLALHASEPVRARALLALGTESLKANNVQSAREFYHEATSFLSVNNLRVSYQIQKMIAVQLSIDGDHLSALRILESIRPLVRAATKIEPVVQTDYLNSYALELAQVGRIDEAENIARIVIGSSAVNHFPEYKATLGEVVSMKQHRKTYRRKIKLKPAPKQVAPIVNFPCKPDAQAIYNERLDILHLATVGEHLSLARCRVARRILDTGDVSNKEVEIIEKALESLKRESAPISNDELVS